MVKADGVASVNGTPKAFAARASESSAPWRPALMPPVGAIANGKVASRPSNWVFMSTAATFTSTLGSSRTRSKAARFSRSVTSSSAPPSKKSKMARGRRRRASCLRSSMLTIRDRSAIIAARTLPSKGFPVSRPFRILLLLPWLALSQVFPAKPMRMVVPFTPAGAVDIASRATAHELSRILGQPVAVENKPGAGGNLGVLDVARSAPDGYSVVMTTSGIQAINPFVDAKMPLEVNKQLAPVAPIVSLNNVLVVHPSVPAHSVKEIIALARKEPGKLTYASSGNGTSIHMSGAMFIYLTKTDIVHIPYKGSAPAVTDLLAGQTNMMFDNIPSSLPHIKAGKLVALATTGAKRDPALPDLPTIAESGVKGYESGVWFGLMVPAGTPKDVVGKLNAAAVQATKSPEFIKRMTDLGYNIIPGSPEDMTRMLEAELKRWAPIVKASGAKVD